jgi:hypothetical protein
MARKFFSYHDRQQSQSKNYFILKHKKSGITLKSSVSHAVIIVQNIIDFIQLINSTRIIPFC